MIYKSLLSLFLLFSSLLAFEENITFESNITNTLEQNETLQSFEENPKDIYLSFVEKNLTPLYKNQIFTLEYKLLFLGDRAERVVTTFSGGKNIRVLNEESEWRKIDNNSYINRFFYKALDTKMELPTLEVEILDGDLSSEVSLGGKNLEAIELGEDREFSGVIASSLELLDYRSSSYNETHNILVIELKGLYSNLEDFRSKKYQFQGIENILNDLPTSEIIYYAIVPKSLDFFTFDYFNSSQNEFETIKVANISENEKVSTQSDIKPKRMNKQYIILALASLSALFLILFIIRRKKIFIALILIFSALLAYYLVPQKKVEIYRGSDVRILPTERSSIFYKTDKPLNATYLSKKYGYIKVLFEDGKIGWVEDSDIVKN